MDTRCYHRNPGIVGLNDHGEAYAIDNGHPEIGNYGIKRSVVRENIESNQTVFGCNRFMPEMTKHLSNHETDTVVIFYEENTSHLCFLLLLKPPVQHYISYNTKVVLELNFS